MTPDNVTLFAAMIALISTFFFGLVSFGTYRLFERLINGLLDSMQRFNDRLELSEARVTDEIQKTRHSVHNMHQAFLGAPQSIPPYDSDGGEDASYRKTKGPAIK